MNSLKSEKWWSIIIAWDTVLTKKLYNMYFILYEPARKAITTVKVAVTHF